METTTLGFTKLLPSEKADYEFTYTNMDLLDRLLQFMMNHHHDGVEGDDVSPPSPPTITEDPTEGLLRAGTTYYYRVSVVGDDGVESQASLSSWVTISGGIDQPDIPTVNVVTTGGDLPSGVYQYAVTCWVDTWTKDTTAVPITVDLASIDGDSQQVELTMPTLPSGADGYNIYRRFPGSTLFTWQATLTGTQVDPWVNDTLTDPGTYRTLPTTDLTAYRKSVEVERPSGATSWRIYRSTDDDVWQGSYLSDATSSTFLDGGSGTSFGAPPPAFLPYHNPDPLVPSEIVAFPQTVAHRTAGAATVGTLLEWTNPFDPAVIAGVSVSLDAGTTPNTQDLTFDVDRWNGATWDTLGSFALGMADGFDSWDSSTFTDVDLAEGDQLRVNVTQVGDGGDTGLYVQLNLWATPAGAGWSAWVTPPPPGP